MSDTVITNYITAVTVDGDQVTVEISPTGPPGAGVPAGGATGQVLKKASGADYDTEWEGLDLSDLSDVDTTGATDGDALVFEGGVWEPKGVVLTDTSGSVGINAVWSGTQAEYDLIGSPDANTLYVIVEP